MYPNKRGLECPKYTELIAKKTAKSPVWKYFGLPVNETGQLVSENVAICKMCKYPVSSKGGSTTNLLTHLKCYHPAEYCSINLNNAKRSLSSATGSEDSENIDGAVATASATNSTTAQELLSQPPHKKQKTLLDFQPLNPSSEKQCTAAVAKFIATAMQPYNIVESPPFVEMVRTMNPRYKLPGRKYFSKNAIPKLYNETKEKIKRELALVKSKNICITTDCWTSVSQIPFISITAHFIDSSWEIKYACLNCVHFDVDHTAENISELLKDKLGDWNININELCSCTTDNGSNIVKAISVFDMQHVPCFGHTINIGINKALQIPTLHKAIARVKKLQNTIAHSWKMSRDLSKAQDLLQMKNEKLPSACPTRWWSTLKLCKRFLDNQLPLCKLLQDYSSKKHLMLEGNEVSALEDFVSATTLMEDITKNLSSEKYTTASSLLPLLTKMKKNLQHKGTDGSLTKKIKSSIISALEERYFSCSQLMSLLKLATVCDPRFRLSYIENENEARQLVLSEMILIYEAETSMPNEKNVNEKREKYGLEKLLESDDSDSEVNECTLLPSSKAENELSNYLSMPKISLNNDPLAWWKAHETSFCSLKILAKKFLAVQGTSVPSERVFSTSGNVISKHRSSLLPKNAEMQIFLTENKKFI